MLPVMRHNEYLYEIPQFSVEKDDIDDFMGQLRAFHGEFSEYFCRQEPRDHFFNYMSGRFSDIERKTAEAIAIRTSGRSSVRAMQRNLCHAVWDEPGILRKYHEMLRAEMGDAEGVLISDESGFVKKGKDSAGVARQYCGTVGKAGNCQVGVFAAYASRHGYALVNKRLFIPEKRIGDDFGERRKKCEIPPDAVFKTKPELAAEQSFEEIKSELGGDHYEVRKYNGWHRHMLTCIPEHFFLWHIKITSGKKSALTHFAAGQNASQDRTANEDFLCCGNH